MADFTVKVEGLVELQAKLKTMGKEMADAIEEAVFNGALVVVRAAQENSARGGSSFPHRITGNLYRSIPAVSPAILSKTNSRVVATVGSSAEYARRLERGFMGTDSRGRRYHQSPRPFLRPALDENTGKVELEIKKRMLEIMGRYS